MTPFLIATLLALIVVGALGLIYRRGDMRLFRKALIGSAVAVLLVTGYLAWISGGKLDRIGADQVVLGDLRMVEAAGSFRLEGHVRNRSSTHTLVSVPIRLRVEDCAAGAAPAATCPTVYDHRVEVPMTVGPGADVEFRHVFVPATPIGSPAGVRRWHAEAGNPRAYEIKPR